MISEQASSYVWGTLQERRSNHDTEYFDQQEYSNQHQTCNERGQRMENHLAENIRSARKRAGLTQEQLADRLGITLGTVSKWERGASEPEIGFLMDLAEVFRISVDALIGF